MKTIPRLVSLAAAVGALLLASGCYTTKTARAFPDRAEYHVTVVDSSPGLEVTPQMAAEFRTSVVKYLADNGVNRSGDYLVRVNLTPGQPEETGQWVVLKVSFQESRTYTLLAAYPGPDDYYPYEFFGYYNNGFPEYARYGYFDPFDYNYGYGNGGSVFPPTFGPTRRHQPDDKDNRPPVVHTRWDDNRPDPAHPKDHKPDPDNRRNWDRPRTQDPDGNKWSPRDRSDNHQGTPRPETSNSSRSYSPPPAREYSPPPARDYSPPPAREYSPPPERSEPASQPRETQSRKEQNEP